MLKSHISCVLLTVCGISFTLATFSGEVAENLRRGGGFSPCTWQGRSDLCKGDAYQIVAAPNIELKNYTDEWRTMLGKEET